MSEIIKKNPLALLSATNDFTTIFASVNLECDYNKFISFVTDDAGELFSKMGSRIVAGSLGEIQGALKEIKNGKSCYQKAKGFAALVSLVAGVQLWTTLIFIHSFILK